MRIWTKYKTIYLYLTSLWLSTPSLATNLFHDWLPLSEQQSICSGYYLPPHFSKQQLGNQDYTIQAQNTQLLSNGQIVLQGKVSIAKEGNRLHTDALTLLRNPKTNKIISGKTSGTILFEQPQTRVFATQATFTNSQNIMQLFNTQYRFYNQHARGMANKITIKNNQYAILNRVNYTTCPPNETFWLLSAKKLTLDKKKNKGQAYDAILKIKGVPILYTPYLSFPMTKKRKSGFLTPVFGTTHQQTYLGLPYYFNLAPNYDLLFTPKWYEKQGLLYNTTTRYLSASNNGQLELDYLYQDKQTHSNRYLISWQNTLNNSPFIHGYINYNQLSDTKFLKDFGDNINTTNTLNIDQTINLNYTDAYNFIGFSAQSWQSLEPNLDNTQTNYSLVPGLSWSTTYPLLNKKFNNQLQVDIDHFNRKSQDNTLPKQALRIHALPELSYNWQQPYAYFKSNVSLASNFYNLNNDINQSQSSSIKKMIPSLTLDNGLFFDRTISLNHQNYHQTLEPRLTYQYTPFINQNNVPLFDTGYHPLNAENIYNTNRFTGYDRISNANQLILAATSRWLDANGDQKNLFTLGQQLQFSPIKVTLCTDSELNMPDTASYACQQSLTQAQNKNHLFALFNHQLNEQFSWQSDLIWANQDNNPYTLHLGMNYQLTPTRLINLGLYNSNDATSFPGTQLHLGAAWNLNNHWNLLGISYLDIKKQKFINNFIGLEYESCCWAVRAGARKWLNPQSTLETNQDTQIYFEFALKGLSQFGPNYRSLVTENIPGYQDNFGHL